MLTSRTFIEKQELKVLLDTETFNSLLSARNAKARAVLACAAEFPFISLVRTPGSVYHAELEAITPFDERLDSDGNLLAIEIGDDSHRYSAAFGYRIQDIETVAGRLSVRPAASVEETRQVTLAFAQSCLTRAGRVDFLVTDKQILLRNRLWLESRYPGSPFADSPLSIATVDEAAEILDLFLKNRDIYHIPGPFENTAWYHYWLSFRSKVPYYHAGDPTVDALAKRFTFILMCLDRIGCEHYSHTGHSAMVSTEYHFNYLLSLMTGVFDSLAIRTNDQFDLGFGTTPHRVSLDPNPGKEFLKSMRDGGEPLPDLRGHIQLYVYFIKLVYALRHAVIHREMLPPVTFRMRDKSEHWEMNLLGPIESAIANLIRQCGDEPEQYGPFSIWGLYEVSHEQETDFYLLPFRFASTAVQTLITFTNRYLLLLGFTDFLEGSKDLDRHNDFVETLELFKQLHLGF